MPTCTICKENKPATEFIKGGRSDGTSCMCQLCNIEYHRKWRADNRQSEIDRCKKYREENREQVRERSRIRMQAKRLADREKTLKYTREYRAKNPEKTAVWEAKKKAVRRGAKGDDTVTAREWREIRQKYRQSCAYCLKPFARLQMDHIVPLSKGGRHIAENIAPACGPCNASKQARDAMDWASEKHWRLF